MRINIFRIIAAFLIIVQLFQRRTVEYSTPGARFGSVYSPDLREQWINPVSCLDWRSLELLHLRVQVTKHDHLTSSQ